MSRFGRADPARVAPSHLSACRNCTRCPAAAGQQLAFLTLVVLV